MARFVRVLASAAVLFLSLLTVPRTALALGTRDQAMSYCQSYHTGLPAGSTWSCADAGGPGSGTWYIQLSWCDHRASPCTNHPADSDKRWFYAGLPPTDQEKCLAMPSYPASFGSNIAVCRSGCTFSPGAIGETWTVKGIDGQARSGGAGTYAPTGGVCNGGPSVTQPPPVVEPPRRLCGGGSCYDSAAKQYCAVSAGGAQVCVPAPAPGAAGGCVSGGDTTLCAGSPPPLPPASKVPDPASQIASSDKYTKTDGSGGQATTVNNYNDTGGTPNSGAGSSDNTPPASSSSSPTPGKDGTTASGGGDCASPPIVEGSAALGMVVQQQWLARCQGDGSSSNDGDTTVPGLEGVGESLDPGVSKEVTLLDKLDATGFGGPMTCPKFPAIQVPMFGVDYQDEPPGWCDMLSAAGKMIMLLAAFVSLRVLSEK